MSLNRTVEGVRTHAPWSLDLLSFFREGLPQLGVTDLIFNTGHHWTAGEAGEVAMDQLFAEAAGALKRGNAWWRTTTVDRKYLSGGRTLLSALTNKPAALTAIDKAAEREGLGVLPFTEVTASLRKLPEEVAQSALVPRRRSPFTHKEVHYVCSVYRELNLLMLNALCEL